MLVIVEAKNITNLYIFQLPNYWQLNILITLSTFSQLLSIIAKCLWVLWSISNRSGLLHVSSMNASTFSKIGITSLAVVTIHWCMSEVTIWINLQASCMADFSAGSFWRHTELKLPVRGHAKPLWFLSWLCLSFTFLEIGEFCHIQLLTSFLTIKTKINS